MIKKYKYILYTYSFLILIGMIPLLLFDDLKLCMIINSFHNIYLDNFFYYISFLGNGFFYILIFCLLTLLRVKNKYLIGAGFGFLITIVVVKCMKYIFFSSHLRPAVLLPTSFNLHIVKDIVLKKEFSFPSGHAAVIFAMICFLALLIRPNFIYLIIFFIIACLTSLSRIYLGQHFYKDIFFGGFIGGTSTIFSFLLFSNLKKFEYFLDNDLLTLTKTILNDKF
ncbi:MAG: phosphatase PAP2 family protein [Bacteroidetes bacterium]|nr:phosphatase PAP2 family protein [Bacteroidota bacterium]